MIKLLLTILLFLALVHGVDHKKKRHYRKRHHYKRKYSDCKEDKEKTIRIEFSKFISERGRSYGSR